MTPVSLQNARGQRLAGILHGEANGALVISCHGMLSNKQGDKHLLLAKELESRGVPMLRFDFAGCGESEGSIFDTTYSGRVEDLDAAIGFFAKQGVERFALFGSSMGGAVALLAAARDERVIAIATLAAVGNTQEIDERYPDEARSWHTRGFIETEAGRIGRTLYDDAMAHDVCAAVRILHAPILVVHGEEDGVVPPTDAHDLASAARNASLEMVSGADHRFSRAEHLRPTMRRVADFLASALT